MNDRESALEALTSWKEIAAYLGRSVRTVRRWEATEGLPVRRHRHRKGSTVFAMREEIDAWREQRQVAATTALATLNPIETTPRTEAPVVTAPALSRWWPRLAAALAMVALGATAGWIGRGWHLRGIERSQPGVAAEPASLSEGGNLESMLHRSLPYVIANGVVELCEDTPQEPNCLLLQESVAQMRPKDFRANFEAAFALAAHGADLDRAAIYAGRAAELLSEHVVSNDEEAAAWVLMFEARRHWADGDAGGSLASAGELEATLPSWPPRLRNLLARDLGTLALALGRTAEARTWFERISDLDFRHEMLAWYLFASGQKDQLMPHLAQEVTYREPFTAILLAMTGNPETAAELIDRVESERLSADKARLARGAVTFFEGRHEEAIGSLETTLAQMNESGDPIFFAGSDILAMARGKQGQIPQAIEALEMTQRQRDRAMFWSAGIHWIMCQSRLAGLYESAGQSDLQRSTDDEIRERLRFADEDFPVLTALANRAQRG